MPPNAFAGGTSFRPYLPELRSSACARCIFSRQAAKPQRKEPPIHVLTQCRRRRRRASRRRAAERAERSPSRFSAPRRLCVRPLVSLVGLERTGACARCIFSRQAAKARRKETPIHVLTQRHRRAGTPALRQERLPVRAVSCLSWTPISFPCHPWFPWPKISAPPRLCVRTLVSLGGLAPWRETRRKPRSHREHREGMREDRFRVFPQMDTDKHRLGWDSFEKESAEICENLWMKSLRVLRVLRG